MMRIVVLATTAVAAYAASRKLWSKFKEHASNTAEGEDGEDGGPMQVLARGAITMQSNMGPWSLSDMALGLTALAKMTEKKPPSFPGKEVKELEGDPDFLLRAQHWRALAEAAYAPDSGTFSLFSALPESAIVHAEWAPDSDTFRPAYCVCVDAPHGAVVLAVRGTSHIIDMLLNSGTTAEPLGDGPELGHGGYVHAAKLLYDEAVPHIERAFRGAGEDFESVGDEALELVVVGHSMGAAVGAMISIRLREKYPGLQCWGYCPPACMTLDLARDCRAFTTSFVAAFDLVPRFSLHSVERLRAQLQEIDFEEVERVCKDDPDYQNIKSAMDTFRSLQEAGDRAGNRLQEAGDRAGGAVPEGLTNAAHSVMNSQPAQNVKSKAADLGQKAGGFLKRAESVHSEDGQKGQEGEDGEEEEEQSEPPPPLYPPGRILLLGCEPPGSGKLPEMRSGVSSQRSYGCVPTFDEKRRIAWRMVEVDQEDLGHIVVSPWLISDHMLGNLCEAIGYFQSRARPALLTKQ